MLPDLPLVVVGSVVVPVTAKQIGIIMMHLRYFAASIDAPQFVVCKLTGVLGFVWTRWYVLGAVAIPHVALSQDVGTNIQQHWRLHAVCHLLDFGQTCVPPHWP